MCKCCPERFMEQIVGNSGGKEKMKFSPDGVKLEWLLTAQKTKMKS